MQPYKDLQRLQAEEHIGYARHMAVRRRYVDSFPLHWHNYSEIEIILSGSGRHFLNGVEYPITRGQAYLLTPVDFHEVQVQLPVELINISFDETCLLTGILQLAAESTKCRILPEDALGRLESAAELLRHACDTDGPCKEQLLEYLLCSFCNPEKRTTEQLTGIRKAIAYLELHFREKITLEQLAALSGYNPNYFSELFRKVTGQSYIARLKTLRLRYAAMLLRNGLSVSDACYASGFGSASNFLTAFKEHYGVPPSEYKK